MKKISVLIFYSLISCGLFSQTASDEKAVRLVFKQLHDAWLAHDYAFDVYDTNAVAINPIGMYWKNKDEIRKNLQFLGKIRFNHMTVVKDSIMTIRFLSPTAVLVFIKNVDRVDEDFTMPGSNAMEKKGKLNEGLQSYTLAKAKAGWKVTSFQITEIINPTLNQN